jgi:hypothetical protein
MGRHAEVNDESDKDSVNLARLAKLVNAEIKGDNFQTVRSYFRINGCDPADKMIKELNSPPSLLVKIILNNAIGSLNEIKHQIGDRGFKELITSFVEKNFMFPVFTPQGKQLERSVKYSPLLYMFRKAAADKQYLPLFTLLMHACDRELVNRIFATKSPRYLDDIQQIDQGKQINQTLHLIAHNKAFYLFDIFNECDINLEPFFESYSILEQNEKGNFLRMEIPGCPSRSLHIKDLLIPYDSKDLEYKNAEYISRGESEFLKIKGNNEREIPVSIETRMVIDKKALPEHFELTGNEDDGYRLKVQIKTAWYCEIPCKCDGEKVFIDTKTQLPTNCSIDGGNLKIFNEKIPVVIEPYQININLTKIPEDYLTLGQGKTRNSINVNIPGLFLQSIPVKVDEAKFRYAQYVNRDYGFYRHLTINYAKTTMPKATIHQAFFEEKREYKLENTAVHKKTDECENDSLGEVFKHLFLTVPIVTGIYTFGEGQAVREQFCRNQIDFIIKLDQDACEIDKQLHLKTLLYISNYVHAPLAEYYDILIKELKDENKADSAATYRQIVKTCEFSIEKLKGELRYVSKTEKKYYLKGIKNLEEMVGHFKRQSHIKDKKENLIQYYEEESKVHKEQLDYGLRYIGKVMCVANSAQAQGKTNSLESQGNSNENEIKILLGNLERARETFNTLPRLDNNPLSATRREGIGNTRMVTLKQHLRIHYLKLISEADNDEGKLNDIKTDIRNSRIINHHRHQLTSQKNNQFTFSRRILDEAIESLSNAKGPIPNSSGIGAQLCKFFFMELFANSLLKQLKKIMCQDIKKEIENAKESEVVNDIIKKVTASEILGHHRLFNFSNETTKSQKVLLTQAEQRINTLSCSAATA